MPLTPSGVPETDTHEESDHSERGTSAFAGWFTDTIGVFLGAVFGANYSYGATVYHDRNDSAARRDALFRALRHQLAGYPPEMHRFVLGMHNHIDPIAVSAIGHLLASNVLDARKDGVLIEKLSGLASRIEQLNEIGRIYNLNFFTAALYVNNQPVTEERGGWYQTYSNIYRDGFVKQRDEVLALLPPVTSEDAMPSQE